ncbi:hypothetical protein BGZ95_003983 [Linnemannia exigua]|uniref:F-box domain-containing protein n=1 Tax=Linnemannia exigua TaxID=604196 RepID=A0AAD4DHT0_9FUNG|nr:hypothetical protein BGZ95_003983 [Linnemannia exigua]
MATFLDLPDEIRLLIGKQLRANSIYSCILVCRTFYSSFISCLWSHLSVKVDSREEVNPTLIRANAHRVESLTYSAALTEGFYTIVYPRLLTLRLNSFYADKNKPNYLAVQPQQKVQFARMHPTVRKLTYNHKDILPKEFWEVVGEEWRDFEELEFTGTVKEGAVEAFWKSCDRVKRLDLSDVNFPESMPVLSTLSFERLRDLAILKYPWRINPAPRTWPIQLLQQVKHARDLKRITWDVGDVAFPVQLVMDALHEGCWPSLYELSVGDPTFSDQDLAGVLGALTSRKLTALELTRGRFGPLAYNCIRERYFDHLRDLSIGKCLGATSAMVQEILTECVHLVALDAQHIFVRDIATAQKPWVCLGLQNLAVYIVKQAEDEAAWEGLVFEQVARLRMLRVLDLQGDPHRSYLDDEPRPHEIQRLETLDFRLPSQDNPVDSSTSSSSNIRRWSSLVQLRVISFNGDRQNLGMKEALWMTEHWRDLTCVGGDFKAAESGEFEELRSLFSRKGIVHLPDIM